jgi:hypothetical protein
MYHSDRQKESTDGHKQTRCVLRVQISRLP